MIKAEDQTLNTKTKYVCVNQAHSNIEQFTTIDACKWFLDVDTPNFVQYLNKNISLRGWLLMSAGYYERNKNVF